MSSLAPEKYQKLADVQAGQDERQVKIDKVGVKNIRYPIIVQDKSGNPQNTIGTVNMFVDLPHRFKGTHMSRFLEVLNEVDGAIGVDSLPQILQEMKRRLHAETAHFSVLFPYFITKYAPVSGAPGIMSYDCGFEAASNAHEDFILSVRVPVTTLCPCSKEISLKGAHNQRGEVDLRVRFEKTIWLEELIEWVEESASCALYPVLKRQDEKYVTEKAYENPRFVEDLVREVALRLRADGRVNWFQIHVENFESIHSHNAYAFIEENPHIQRPYRD
jgi:GTP cyclohydrolase I